MPDHICPDRRCLESLLAGTLPEAEQGPVAAHVEGCAACQKTLEGLAGQSWVGRARRLAEPPAPPEPALAEVMAAALAGGSTQTLAGDTAGESDDALAFLAPPGQPDSLGRIGHYEVLEVLGKGGFGIVFRAFDDVLQRVVAIKVLAPQLAATSPARKRFLREARAAAAIKHDNVVQIHATEEQPLPYLVMEYVPGETLQQRLDRIGPLEVAEVVRIGRQIAEGLAAAHANDLIHRDIKPANVLIESGPQGRAKLTDFGLARTADDASLSQSGVVAGTPMYMAPEQAKAESLDHRADLFSLGSVLYAMLTGRPPFRASTTFAVLKRVAEDTPRPIREVIPEVPEWLCRVVEKLHAKDPAERFPSAREVADLLADCEAQLKAHGMLKDYSRIPGGTPAAPPRRARWLWGAAALLLLALGAAAVGLSWWIQDARRTEVVLLTPPDYELIVTIDGREVPLFNIHAKDPITWLAPGEHHLRVHKREPITWHDPDGRDLPVFKDDRRILIYEETFTLAPGDRKVISIPEPRLPDSSTPSPNGGVLLFNGKDLTGWIGDTRFCKVERGTLIAQPDDHGISLRTERGDFKNFVLRFECNGVPAGEAVPVLNVLLHGAARDDPEQPKRQAVVQFTAGGSGACGLTASPFQIEKDFQQWKHIPGDPPWFSAAIRCDKGRIEVIVGRDLVAEFWVPETSAGHIGLQVQKGKWRFRNIEVRELPPVPVTGLSFVVVARDGQAERPCATLREAITAASSGDTVEIRNDGPFLVPPLVVRGKALTIRAAAGRRPVLQLRGGRSETGRWFLLESDAPLVLEGLELQRDCHGSQLEHQGVVSTSRGAPLYMANCRLQVFDAENIPLLHAQLVEVHSSRPSQFCNCEFIGGKDYDALACSGPGGVVVDQCVLTRPLRINVKTKELPFAGAPIRVSRSTLLGPALVVHRWSSITAADLDAAQFARAQVHLEENVLAGSVLMVKELPEREPPTPAEVQAFLRRLITWSEGPNVVSDDSAPMAYYWGRRAGVTLLRENPTLADWQQFWKLERATGSWGRVRFQTESLAEKARGTPDTVSAADFRLRDDSLGKRAGPGGKDLGADVDRVGPGKAYEQWKKTDDYRAWRKQVEDLMAQP